MLEIQNTSGTAVILSGWKEIANYLRRGVRTVQRWEKVGLPIRRPSAQLRTAVIARARDLDAWMANASTGEQIVASELRRSIQALEVENAELRRELMRLKSPAAKHGTNAPARRSTAA